MQKSNKVINIKKYQAKKQGKTKIDNKIIEFPLKNVDPALIPNF